MSRDKKAVFYKLHCAVLLYAVSFIALLSAASVYQ